MWVRCSSTQSHKEHMKIKNEKVDLWAFPQRLAKTVSVYNHHLPQRIRSLKVAVQWGVRCESSVKLEILGLPLSIKYCMRSVCLFVDVCVCSCVLIFLCKRICPWFYQRSFNLKSNLSKISKPCHKWDVVEFCENI